jgi:pimeloyl-ACP methyl ester carboxylesterase
MANPLPPPLGQLVDVGGHRLHALTLGDGLAGAPTVVFEAGGASWSLDWQLVQPEVARFAPTVAYDRAGFGWSDPGPRPRTAAQMARELKALLRGISARPPFVLVGASFGGHVARLLAMELAGDVAGVVLLDARHQAINEQMPPAWRKLEVNGKGMYQVLLAASRLGALNLLGRLAGERAAPPIVHRLPQEIRPAYLAVGFQPKYFQANLDELAASAESDQQLAAAGALGDVPLTVIRHGRPDLFAQMPPEQAAQAERVWQDLQAQLAGLSSNSQLLVAEHSGHAIQIGQPELVIESIRALVSVRV